MTGLLNVVLTILVLAAAMSGAKSFMLAYVGKAKASTKGTRGYYVKWALAIGALLLMCYIFFLFTQISSVL